MRTAPVPVGTFDLDGALPFIPQYDSDSATATLIVRQDGALYVVSRHYQDDEEETVTLVLSHVAGPKSVAGDEQVLTRGDEDYDTFEESADVAERAMIQKGHGA